MEHIARPIKSRRGTLTVCLRSGLLLTAISLWCGPAAAQSSNELGSRQMVPAKRTETEQSESLALPVGERAGAASTTERPSEGLSSGAANANAGQSQFRVERLPLVGGAELLTIFGRLDGMRGGGLPAPEVPLVSVVRDTMSDNDPENDRLRYLWMLTYTRPTMLKRIASAVPFLYQQIGNKKQASKSPPAPILDLANSGRQTWNHFFWMGLQNIFLDSYGIPLKAASRSYRRNAADYRGAHVSQALSILGNYENLRQRSRDESELLAFRQSSTTDQLTNRDGRTNDMATPL